MRDVMDAPARARGEEEEVPSEIGCAFLFAGLMGLCAAFVAWVGGC